MVPAFWSIAKVTSRLRGVSEILSSNIRTPCGKRGIPLNSRYRRGNRQTFTRFRKFLRARIISHPKYRGTSAGEFAQNVWHAQSLSDGRGECQI